MIYYIIIDTFYWLDEGDVKAVVSVLNFILNNAVKYAISDDALTNELTQLGLPKGILIH